MRRNLKTVWLVLWLGMAMPLQPAQQASEKQKEGSSAGTRVGPKDERNQPPATEDPTYIIGPDDVLDINVWKEPEVSRTIPVRPDGKISIPLVHDIEAAGLTPLQLQARLAEKLKKFLTEPEVTVIVRGINSRRVFVLGEVSRPGSFPLLPNMTVLQAISSAGGFAQFANTDKVRVLRTENGKQISFKFNYKDVISGRAPEQNIVLKPGDTIVVP